MLAVRSSLRVRPIWDVESSTAGGHVREDTPLIEAGSSVAARDRTHSPQPPLRLLAQEPVPTAADEAAPLTAQEMRGDGARGDPQPFGDLARTRTGMLRQIRSHVLPGDPPDR